MLKTERTVRVEGAATAAGSELGSKIDSLDSLRSYLRADLRSRGGKEFFGRLFLLDPVVRFITLMRVLEYLQNTGKPRVLRLPLLFWFRRLSVRLGFSVPPGVFGPGLAIVHYGLLVVAPTARIGRNCRIHAGVNIGGMAKIATGEVIGRDAPFIGHNVYIGPGAKLYGPIDVGDDCTIGANAVVTKSFAEPALVLAGVPAKIIARQSSAERLIKGADPEACPE